jgi:hypothetical protein
MRYPHSRSLPCDAEYIPSNAQDSNHPDGSHAFWSVTMYQDHFLTPNTINKYSVSKWMNPQLNPDGSLTIYIQPTSPGPDKESDWLPSSGSIPAVIPRMRLYWPLQPALDGTWTPPPAVEVV